MNYPFIADLGLLKTENNHAYSLISMDSYLSHEKLNLETEKQCDDEKY